MPRRGNKKNPNRDLGEEGEERDTSPSTPDGRDAEMAQSADGVGMTPRTMKRWRGARSNTSGGPRPRERMADRVDQLLEMVTLLLQQLLDDRVAADPGMLPLSSTAASSLT
ncbi:unnamed protein product [Lampetra fluviatilis]